MLHLWLDQRQPTTLLATAWLFLFLDLSFFNISFFPFYHRHIIYPVLLLYHHFIIESSLCFLLLDIGSWCHSLLYIGSWWYGVLYMNEDNTIYALWNKTTNSQKKCLFIRWEYLRIRQSQEKGWGSGVRRRTGLEVTWFSLRGIHFTF